MNNKEGLFYQQENHFWSAICLETAHIDDHVIAYFSELPLPVFNFIYLHKDATITGFENARHLFKQRSKPYVLVVHEQALHQVKSEIAKLSLIADGESTAMFLPQASLSQYSIALPLAADYRIETCNERLTNWAQPLITAFPIEAEGEENDSTVINEYIRYHQRAMDKNTNMMHFVLFDKQQPVSTLTLTINEKTARLDDIGTDVQYQGKGLATQLIKHALFFCHQQGIEQCVLEASSDGLSIYKKLGFEPIFNYYSFIAE